MKKISGFQISATVVVLFIIGSIGMFDAVKDTLAHHYSISIFAGKSSAFWDANVSWCNKWMNCEPGKERFLGSSTVFVFLTDGWHLMKFFQLRLSMLFPAFLLFALYADNLKKQKNFSLFLLFVGIYVLCTVVQNLMFSLFYDYLLLD